jgi:hypothetical protein
LGAQGVYRLGKSREDKHGRQKEAAGIHPYLPQAISIRRSHAFSSESCISPKTE